MGDPITMTADEIHRIDVAIGVVTGVEQQVNPSGIGLGDEIFDLLLGLDVCLCVCMEHQFEPKPVADNILGCVDGLDQPRPPRIVETGR